MTIARMRAMTLSREYGSGGGKIAARLARRLQWQLIDHEVVVRVAQQLQVSEADAEAYDEHVESLATRTRPATGNRSRPMPLVLRHRP